MTYYEIIKELESLEQRISFLHSKINETKFEKNRAIILNDFEFNTRTLHVFKAKDIHTLDDLYKYGSKIKNARNFGRKCFADMNEILINHGFDPV